MNFAAELTKGERFPRETQESIMANINADPKQMEQLLKVVSSKLGVSPESLRKDLESGKFDSALKNMKPAEAATFNKMISNPKLLEQFMSTPQAQALYNKLTRQG